MKLIKKFVVAAGGLALSALTSQANLVLDIANSPGATIQFNGSADTFQFNASSWTGFAGSQFYVNNESGSDQTGSALGLQGSVLNGPFSYGPIITTSGDVQTATVNGPLGQLSISGLTGNVNWMTVSTDLNAGGINAALTVNITGLTYTGSNPDLQTMVAEGQQGGSMDIVFSFNPNGTLTDLSTGAPQSSTFAGTIAVPEPGTLIAGALLLLPFGASTIRLTRKSRAR